MTFSESCSDRSIRRRRSVERYIKRFHIGSGIFKTAKLCNCFCNQYYNARSTSDEKRTVRKIL